MIFLLIIASVFAIINNELADGIVILTIVLLNGIVSFFQQFRAEKALQALNKLVSKEAKVIRDEKPQLIATQDLVPGDLVLLESGDLIPADGELVEVNSLLTQESSLTGESATITKNLGDKVYLGTTVNYGFGKFTIQKTGSNTEFGKIAKLTNEVKTSLSPLQKELKLIGKVIFYLALVIGTGLFLHIYFSDQKTLVEALLFASSVAVAAVPEGLPTLITITLALSMQKLAQSGAIIKQLTATETLGSVATIITDKTGTLTKNEMTVTEIQGLKYKYEVTGTGYNPDGGIYLENIMAPNIVELNFIALISHFCVSTKINENQVLGDPTEAALIILSQKIINQFKLDKNYLKNFTIKKVIPFDSNRKCMTVLVQNLESKTPEYLELTKGAPEVILKKCNLSEKEQESLNKKNNNLAATGLRVIALATKVTQKEHISENNLEFLGLVAIKDPLRPEIPNVIQQAKQAGIQIIVATGDNPITAKTIGQNAGIINDSTPILTNEDLDKMSEAKLKSLIISKSNLIFARVSAENKLRLVNSAKSNQQVVAVTGDGVNDAPAIKQADIGIAMGITGTDVSKEAAKMILADDNFATIIKAVMFGRVIFNNLKKLVLYLMSSNIGELTVIILAIVFNLPMPLTAILILLINVVTDAPPALALAFDQSNDEKLLTEKPRDPNNHILNGEFIRHTLSLGCFIGLITLGAFLSVLITNGWQYGDTPTTVLLTKATTTAFATLTLTQFFNAIIISNLNRSIFKFPIRQKLRLININLLTMLFVFILTIVPQTQEIFGLTALSGKLWLTCIIFSSILIPLNEIYVRLFPNQNS
jgi:Ca2+-transporting ATPase